MSPAKGSGQPRIKPVPLQDLKTNDANPRRITPERLEDLKESLRSDPDMLKARPVIALTDGTVVAGNMRVKAAQELGWTTIPCLTVDIDPARARLWMLRDNQSFGQWIEAEVAMLLEDLARQGVDVNATGFTTEDIDRLLKSVAQTTQGADPDDIPERPPPRATGGELWALGPHRLLCADATDPTSYDCLLGDERAAMVWTDPPYGVDYEGKTDEALTIQNDGLAPEAHEDLLYDAFSLALGRCRDGAVWYVTAPSSPPHVEPFVSALGRLDIWQQTLVWVKDSFVLGRSDFHYRHELMLYGWAGSRHKRPPGRHHDTVWEVARPKANREHPTAKPVALIDRALRLSSRRSDVVLDPFVGSGSTVMAAQGSGRRCYGIEIEPRYLDAAIARFERATGISAERLG